jgi:hypothetical protein
LRRNLETAALGILRNPVNELLRFPFATCINRAVEAVHRFGAIRGTSRFCSSKGRGDKNGQPKVSERNHYGNALFAF